MLHTYRERLNTSSITMTVEKLSARKLRITLVVVIEPSFLCGWCTLGFIVNPSFLLMVASHSFGGNLLYSLVPRPPLHNTQKRKIFFLLWTQTKVKMGRPRNEAIEGSRQASPYTYGSCIYLSLLLPLRYLSFSLDTSFVPRPHPKKLGKGPGVTCKKIPVCAESALRNSS